MADYRIYGVAGSARPTSYRLQFAYAPTDAVLRRIAVAIGATRGATDTRVARWGGVFAFLEWNADFEDAYRNLATLNAIHLAWPLVEVVCLSARWPSQAKDARELEAERETLRRQPVPDAGPVMPQPTDAWFKVPMVAGLPLVEREAFASALSEPIARTLRASQLRRWLAEGEPAVAIDPTASLVRAMPPHDAPPRRELRGERAGIAWGPGDAVALLLDELEIPLVRPDAPGDPGPIEVLAVDDSGRRATFLTAARTAVWTIDLDSARVAVAAWAGRDGPFADVAWLDARIVVATAGRVILAIDTGSDTHAKPRVCGRVLTSAIRGTIAVIAKRFIAACGDEGCAILAAAVGGHPEYTLVAELALLAEVECGADASAELDETGRLRVRGRDRAYAIDVIEPAWWRTHVAANTFRAGGEVSFVAGEPFSVTVGTERRYDVGLVVITEGTGEVLADRASGQRCTSVATQPVEIRGPKLLVEGSHVHDGQRLWSVDGCEAFLIEETGPLDRVLATYIDGSVHLALTGDVLALVAKTEVLWRIPCAPVELLAVEGSRAVIRVHGGRTLVLALGRDGAWVCGAWPAVLPEVDAAWSLAVRAGERYFVIPYEVKRHERVTVIDADTGRTAPTLKIETFDEKHAIALAAAERELAEEAERERPEPMTATSQHGIVGIAPTAPRTIRSVSRPHRGHVDRQRGPWIARNHYADGYLVGVSGGRVNALREIDLPPMHYAAGAIAVHPTRPLALVAADAVYLVDLEDATERGRSFVLASARHAVFIGDDHVAVVARGGTHIMRILDRDFVEVARLSPIETVVASIGRRFVALVGTPTPSYAFYVLDGDRPVLVDTLRPSAQRVVLHEIDGELVLECPAAARQLAGWFAITGLDRVVAPRFALDHSELAVVELAGGPPHPNRPNMFDALPAGEPRPSTNPDRWAIETRAGLGLGLARPAPGRDYVLYAFGERPGARRVRPELAGMRFGYGLRPDGRAALIHVHGRPELYEVDLATAAARVVATRPELAGGMYAHGGVIVRDGVLATYHTGEVGPARWSCTWPADLWGDTMLGGRVLFLHRGHAKRGIFLYAITPRGLVALGTADATVLVAWHDDQCIYFLDHYDITRNRRYAITGIGPILATLTGAEEIATTLGDPAPAVPIRELR